MDEPKTAESRYAIKVGDQTTQVRTVFKAGPEGTREGIVEKNSEGLEVLLDCAGEWTRAIARIPEWPYQMTVVNATSPNDAWARARRCWPTVVETTFFSNPILICAPYKRCLL